jgi:hypothetical protein
MSLVLEYLDAVLKCSAKSGYECKYKGWCASCGDLCFNEKDIELIYDFSYTNFKSTNKIDLQLLGPRRSPYSSRILQMNLRLPLEYPEKEPIVKFDHQIYHYNICSVTKRLKIKELKSK